MDLRLCLVTFLWPILIPPPFFLILRATLGAMISGVHSLYSVPNQRIPQGQYAVALACRQAELHHRLHYTKLGGA